jgi:hypothetical protein
MEVHEASERKSDARGCPPNEPWRTAGRSLPMLDAAAKTHILRYCTVYELYLWVQIPYSLRRCLPSLACNPGGLAGSCCYAG